MFKQISNLMSMVGQAREMGSKMNSITEELKTKRAVGSSGGGMVEVEVNGVGDVLSVRVDDTVLADKEMLLDLLPSAFNQATAKSKQLHMDAMKTMTDGMDIPGLEDALSQFSGGPTKT
ncbi:YbaB/EbfC family nucleoid-associated protein [Mariniblastus sp.]|jgi:nucleoid-associated protein EbfC|nr:YbaB/EbfC family nucleoid-associated protein [Mariniblastus sp.]MDB4671016.1 YbaB/EbfC family nucleoid-associated protein [Pirellulaceae bacterium]MDB4756139.1 YbaB/EbfC family nucleoid-associated protein [Mariniblastus sp.]